MEEFAPDLVLTDLKMPGMDGIELLGKIRESDADLPVIVMTAFGEVETAVGAMRAGARDYLTKPVNVDELSVVVEREMAARRLRAEAGLLRARLSEKYSFDNIIGSSAPMQDGVQDRRPGRVVARERAHHRRDRDGQGADRGGDPRAQPARGGAVREAALRGAGRVAARERAVRPRARLVHGRGRARDGRFQQADGGTLFLDEIGEISPAVQVKLLRFLQEHEFERVGGNETISVDVRVIAATNRDLQKMVAEGKFREDLYYRLNVINLEMPPLRARPSDIPLLAGHFLRKYAAENGKAIAGFSAEALERLAGYDWPGNVRELENVVERAVVLAQTAQVTVAELPPQLVPAKERGGLQIPGATMDEIERYAITKTLESTGGSTSRAAEILNLSVRKIQYKLHEYESAPKSSRPPVTEDDK